MLAKVCSSLLGSRQLSTSYFSNSQQNRFFFHSSPIFSLFVFQESPTCNLFPGSKTPASSPLARSTPPIRSKAGPSGRATASEKAWAAKLWVNVRGKDVKLMLKFLYSSPPGPPAPVRPVLAPQPPTGNSQRLSRPQGAAAKPSSRLPVPSAIPRPASRMPLTSRSVPPSKGALPPASLPTRKGLPRPSAAGHRGEEEWT